MNPVFYPATALYREYVMSVCLDFVRGYNFCVVSFWSLLHLELIPGVQGAGGVSFRGCHVPGARAPLLSTTDKKGEGQYILPLSPG